MKIIAQDILQCFDCADHLKAYSQKNTLNLNNIRRREFHYHKLGENIIIVPSTSQCQSLAFIYENARLQFWQEIANVMQIIFIQIMIKLGFRKSPFVHQQIRNLWTWNKKLLINRLKQRSRNTTPRQRIKCRSRRAGTIRLYLLDTLMKKII